MPKIMNFVLCVISFIIWAIFGTLIWIPLLFVSTANLTIVMLGSIITQNGPAPKTSLDNFYNMLKFPSNGFANIKNVYNNNSDNINTASSINYIILIYRILLPIIFYGLIIIFIKL